jgi:pimeloyl-ACP methyl ester carboxylesterase
MPGRSCKCILLRVLLLMALTLAGCGGRGALTSAHAILYVPGAAGNGAWNNGIRQALHEETNLPVHTFTWGANFPFTMLNLQSRSIHNKAEAQLADAIAAWHQQHPAGRLILVAHSAGCGVVLGALPRLPENIAVETVLLLAPSVSPGYDLAPALERIDHRLHVFHSDRDTLFLRWRTGTFGTYDNVRTAAAGHLGFSADNLPAPLRSKLVQHPYAPAWSDLGNNGDHFGVLAPQFARTILAPLLTDRADPASPPSSATPP